jgi:peptidoglycan/xylan/chitin deacetylase (PgdA/CDA1 family)
MMNHITVTDRKSSLARSTIASRAIGTGAEIGEKVVRKLSRTWQTWHTKNIRVPILMYHYISSNPDPRDEKRARLSVTPDTFATHMAFLAQNGYTTITLNTLHAIFHRRESPPAKPIVLTFDDGFVDFYLNAYPILRKHNFCAVVFVIAGSVGQRYYLSWDHIRDMQTSGLISFEAHTVTHPDLTKLSYTKLLNELGESKKILEGQIDQSVHFISYPYGRTSGTVMHVAEQVGFLGGVATWNGKASYPSMDMPRIWVYGHWTLQAFARRL